MWRFWYYVSGLGEGGYQTLALCVCQPLLTNPCCAFAFHPLTICPFFTVKYNKKPYLYSPSGAGCPSIKAFCPLKLIQGGISTIPLSVLC